MTIGSADSYQVLIKNTIELPSPPVVVQRLHELFAMDDVSRHEISRLVETDQSLAARVLRLANSSFYGMNRRIISVDVAITILGLSVTKQLLLTSSLLSSFRSVGQSEKVTSFWLHSLGVAIIARRLVSGRDKEFQSEAFMGGILHDVGRMIFLKSDPNCFSSFYFDEKSVTDLQSEKEAFGINHQEVGGMLAQKWNFPIGICAMISKHHCPLKAGELTTLVSVINIADLLCHAMGIGQSGNHYFSDFYSQAWLSLGLSYDDLENRLTGVRAEISASKDSLL